jgi:adenylate kinase family enzyme
MQRIVVLGTSGSGKTTLARELARRLRVPHIELDAIHWQANWTATPGEQMWQTVDPLTARPAWTLCGNYGSIRARVWERADTLIWLDYSMTLTVSRVVRRTLQRTLQGTELWTGNRERLWTQFFSRDSLFLWVINRWRINRRNYPKRLREQKALGKHVYRFRTPAEAAKWLRGVVARGDKASA